MYKYLLVLLLICLLWIQPSSSGGPKLCTFVRYFKVFQYEVLDEHTPARNAPPPDSKNHGGVLLILSFDSAGSSYSSSCSDKN